MVLAGRSYSSLSRNCMLQTVFPVSGSCMPSNDWCRSQLQGLPSVLGGDSLVRDDSETPEQVAKGNLAKAQQSDGNAIDSLKSKLGL